MDARQAFFLFDAERDSATPYLAPARWAARYTSERLEWLKARADEAETSEVQARLNPFLVSRELTLDGNTAPMSQFDEVPLLTVRALTLDFSVDVNGVMRNLKKRACPPITDDELAVASDDPTRKPDDWFPRHQRTIGGLLIHSDSLPVSGHIRYLRDPGVVVTPPETGTAQPLDEDRKAVDEINKRVMASHLMPPGASGYSALTGREIPAGELNS